MVLASIMFREYSGVVENVMLLPLAIGGLAIFASIIGTFFVRLGPSNNIMGALYKGLIVTGVLSAIAIAGVIAMTTGWARPLLSFTGSAEITTGSDNVCDHTGAVIMVWPLRPERNAD